MLLFENLPSETNEDILRFLSCRDIMNIASVNAYTLEYSNNQPITHEILRMVAGIFFRDDFKIVDRLTREILLQNRMISSFTSVMKLMGAEYFQRPTMRLTELVDDNYAKRIVISELLLNEFEDPTDFFPHRTTRLMLEELVMKCLLNSCWVDFLSLTPSKHVSVYLYLDKTAPSFIDILLGWKLCSPLKIDTTDSCAMTLVKNIITRPSRLFGMNLDVRSLDPLDLCSTTDVHIQ